METPLVLPLCERPGYDTSLIDTLEKLNFSSANEIALLDSTVFSSIIEDASVAPSPLTPSFTARFVDTELEGDNQALNAQMQSLTTEASPTPDMLVQHLHEPEMRSNAGNDTPIARVTDNHNGPDHRSTEGPSLIVHGGQDIEAYDRIKVKKKEDDSPSIASKETISLREKEEYVYKAELSSWRHTKQGGSSDRSDHSHLESVTPTATSTRNDFRARSPLLNSQLQTRSVVDNTDFSILSPLTFERGVGESSFEGKVDPWKDSTTGSHRRSAIPSSAILEESSCNHLKSKRAKEAVLQSPCQSPQESPSISSPHNAWIRTSTPYNYAPNGLYHPPATSTASVAIRSQVLPPSPSFLSAPITHPNSTNSRMAESSTPPLELRTPGLHDEPAAMIAHDRSTPRSIFLSYDDEERDTLVASDRLKATLPLAARIPRLSSAPIDSGHKYTSTASISAGQTSPMQIESSFTAGFNNDAHSADREELDGRSESYNFGSASLLQAKQFSSRSSQSGSVPQPRYSSVSHSVPNIRKARNIRGLFESDYTPCPRSEENENLIFNDTPQKRFNKAINSIMYWTKSEGYLGLLRPDLDTEGLQLGHVHFHRNRENDQIMVWLLDKGKIWEDITGRWGMDTDQPVRHPQNTSIILDTYGESGKWEPSYVTQKTYDSRKHPWKGINDYPGA